MRVIDEGPGPIWHQPDDERIPRRNPRGGMTLIAAPIGDAVVVALDFNAVPVYGDQLIGAIQDGDADGLAAPQHDRTAGNADGVWSRRRCAFLQDKAVSGRSAEILRALVNEEPERAGRRLVGSDGGIAARRHCNPADQTGHARVRMVHLMARLLTAQLFVMIANRRCDVSDEMTMKEPVARPRRNPRHPHGCGGRHELGDRRRRCAALYSVSRVAVPRLVMLK